MTWSRGQVLANHRCRYIYIIRKLLSHLFCDEFCALFAWGFPAKTQEMSCLDVFTEFMIQVLSNYGYRHVIYRRKAQKMCSLMSLSVLQYISKYLNQKWNKLSIKKYHCFTAMPRGTHFKIGCPDLRCSAFQVYMTSHIYQLGHCQNYSHRKVEIWTKGPVIIYGHLWPFIYELSSVNSFANQCTPVQGYYHDEPIWPWKAKKKKLFVKTLVFKKIAS